MAVVLLALFLGRGPVFLAGALSALAWNYFFLPPKFTFIISSTEDFLLFGLYFVVAIVLGQLVARIRAQEQAERLREERATALYQLTRELAQAGTRDEVVWQLMAEGRAFSTLPWPWPSGRAELCAPSGQFPHAHEKGTERGRVGVSSPQAAGRYTDNLPAPRSCICPGHERAPLGVLSVRLPDRT